MAESCRKKQSELIERFACCKSDQDRYAMIIAMGRSLPAMNPDLAIEKNLVSGCQSRTYLHSELVDGRLHFKVQSDALISAGLAALLVVVYSGEKTSTLLTCPPDFLKTLELTRYLTPSRSSGLFAVHLRMKRDAMHQLASRQDQLSG